MAVDKQKNDGTPVFGGRGLVCASFLILTVCSVGCAGFGTQSTRPAPGGVSISDEISRVLEQAEPRGVSELGMNVYGYPRVRAFVKYFQTTRRPFMQQALIRSEHYLDNIHETFERYRLPVALSSVALVESGFDPLAKSGSGAVGMWQFMKRTARSMGLRVTWFKDERLDPEKSTDAAARYLRDLYNHFEDWPLTLAAYNGGITRVRRAVADAGSRDFTRLAQAGYFKKETVEYVPKVLAAMLIMQEPKQHGFY